MMISLKRTCKWIARKVLQLKFVIILFIIFMCILLLNYRIPTLDEIQKPSIPKESLLINKETKIDIHIKQSTDQIMFEKPEIVTTIYSKNKMENQNQKDLSTQQHKVCSNVHAFYYPWYGEPKTDHEYLHWNHQYLPHWNPNIAARFFKGSHIPPDDIGSNFYPELGPYSSSDPFIIEEHMKQLQISGIGVIAVSYYPDGVADDNGKDWQHIFPVLLEYGEKYGISIAFHIEPYKDRNEASVKNDIINIIETYSSSPAFYKFQHHGKTMPLIYIYDSYHTKPSAWAKILKEGPESIRETANDAFIIGLLVDAKDQMEIVNGGFDGFYTYFASNGFTYGSTRHNWRKLSEFARANNLLYIPSIGPGYIDTRIRPWNAENTRQRLKGKYYTESWNAALAEETKIISITSFNEWHEGSQIERAIPKLISGFKYADYSPYTSEFYLQMTRSFIEKFSQCEIEVRH